MTNRVTETFFLPDEVSRSNWSLPADIYNLSHTLLVHSDTDCVFVPIRSMQFLAVITASEIVFVDSLAYACHQNTGGRMIILAWQFGSVAERNSLSDPVPCQVVHYHHDDSRIQLRLVGDYRAALEQLDQRYRNSTIPSGGARIVKLG